MTDQRCQGVWYRGYISPKFFAMPLLILCLHLVLETRQPVAHDCAGAVRQDLQVSSGEWLEVRSVLLRTDVDFLAAGAKSGG